jgi:acyl-CoA reductase-like NAD-dependent aldehyde dehydrogenase
MTITAPRSRLQDEKATRMRWSSDNEADQFGVENPAAGDVITTVHGCGAADVDRPIQAAHDAFVRSSQWTTPQERSALLSRCADVLEEHVDELSKILTTENGKPLADARVYDIQFLVDEFRFWAGLVNRVPSDFFDMGSVYDSVVLEPLGVVGAIIPFNWLAIHTAGKVAPALAVENTMVVKPGPQSRVAIMRIVELINTVLPSDIVHVIPGGTEPGDVLVANSLVKRITFTSSTKDRIAVTKKAVENVTPVTLEPGGKDALVVFDDANLDQAVRDALEGGFFNRGEARSSASWVLVQRGIAEEFTRRVAAGVAALRVGDGSDPATVAGPVVSRARQERVTDWVRIGQQEGATITAQAPLPDDARLAKGFWLPPTLFTGVTRTMPNDIEEIFGSAQRITVFDTEDEAVDIVNDSEYRLVAALYSQDRPKAFRVARRFEAGILHINNYYRASLVHFPRSLGS